MSQIEEPVASIQDGKLRGTTGTNLDGDKFLKFFGIPYAKPPIDTLRFKPPQPALPWDGVRDAKQIGSASISKDDLTLQIVGAEDCLYLNVFTKQLPNPCTPLRPVMVYIHGGGLIFGSNRPGIYGPEFLMTKDIVLVVLNYRLGALGFLSVDGSEVTGNMGLKDQNLALKWVQKNIKSFNGDPNNVTIFGQSAGAASVHAHILSPASKGLFHKAILQSGCALNPWFPGTKNIAREIAMHLGKTCETELEALEVLKQFSGLEIYNAQEKLSDIVYPSFKRPFGYTVESENNTAFLRKHPQDLIKEGSYNHVPMMMGYADTEGFFKKVLGFEVPFFAVPFEMQNIISHELSVPKGTSEHTKLCTMLETVYSGSTEHFDEITDGCFLAGLVEALSGHLETGTNPIYLYRISVVSQMNRLKSAMKALDTPGVSHSDDLGYLWNSDVAPKIQPGSLEDKSIRNFVELWTNFAEFGNPTPNNNTLNISWPQIESIEQLKLLDIGNQLEVKDIPERKRIQVWRDIYDKWQMKTIEKSD